MAGHSETRQRVRELAQQLIDAGETPTQSKIRKMLGKGSPNTVIDELKAFLSSLEASKEKSSPSTAVDRSMAQNKTLPALERLGAAEAVQVIKGAISAAEELRAAATDVQQAGATLGNLPSLLQGMERQLVDIAATFEKQVAFLQAELAKANDRYDGVQKYAMQAIDLARAETRMVKENLAGQADPGGVKLSAYRRQNEDLRVTIARLQGRLEERGQVYSDIPVSARVPEIEPAPAPAHKTPVIKSESGDSGSEQIFASD
jgi:hypothetical protein